MFKIEAQQEVGVGAGEGDANLIQQQITLAFQNATTEVENVDREAESAVQPDNNRYVPNAWLNRAGWAKHLAGLDREWLGCLVRRPERWEKGLKRMCAAVKMVI